MGTMRVDVPGAQVGERIVQARPTQAPEPRPGPDGVTPPWPKRPLGYTGVMATIVRIGPRTGPVATLEECPHRHPRANGALKCALKRFTPEGSKPPRGDVVSAKTRATTPEGALLEAIVRAARDNPHVTGTAALRYGMPRGDERARYLERCRELLAHLPDGWELRRIP